MRSTTRARAIRVAQTGVAAAFLVFFSAMPTEGSSIVEEEILEYRWYLGGFKGTVARLFVPGSGKGTLKTTGRASGNLVSELEISSPAARDDDFWLYGSEIDPEGRRTVRAWSAQKFRGQAKEKESELEDEDVVDLVSGIFFLRREMPERPTQTRIWSRGRLYQVAVKPTRREVKIVDGEVVRTRSYSLRGVGEPRWQGRLDLVLAEDERATPLEITITRDGMRVRLELVDEES